MKDYTDLFNEDLTYEGNEGEESVQQEQQSIPQEAQRYIDMSDEDLDKLASQNPEDNMNILTEENLNLFIKEISRPTGNLISFQSYNYDSPETDPDRYEVTEISDASFAITKNMAYDDLLSVDVSFRSPQDPDLQKLWVALKRHTRNMQKYPDNRWIFFLRVENESNVYAQMMNPIMFFLTRSEPGIETNDELFAGTMQGGNMIRFLFAKDMVIFGQIDEEAAPEEGQQIQEQGE